MVSEENDPDTLQLRDELDTEWVKLWRTEANKKENKTNKLTFIVSNPESTAHRNASQKKEKMR